MVGQGRESDGSDRPFKIYTYNLNSRILGLGFRAEFSTIIQTTLAIVMKDHNDNNNISNKNTDIKVSQYSLGPDHYAQG